jgi:hypothetical protein
MAVVGETAAAIMARHVQPRRDRRWLLGGIAAVTIVVTAIALILVTHAGASTPGRTERNQVAGLTPGADTEAAAARGALAAYSGYQSAYLSAARTRNPMDPRLDRFVGDPALIEARMSLRTMAQSGLVYRGAFKGDVRVTNVSLATQTVQLMNCQDISSLKVVDAKTGKAVLTSTQNPRFPVVAQARYYKGRWVIVKATADRSMTC